MSNLLQLVNEVLRRTGQIEIATLTNAQTPALQTRDFINDTYVEMLQRLRVNRFIRQGSFNSANGVGGYALASDAEINSLLGESVLDVSRKQRLREVDYTWPLSHDPTATGRPEYFYRSGGQLYLYPTPDGVYAYQYQYFAKPAVLSGDTDTLQLPAEWESVLVMGAQARLQKFLGEGGEETYLLYRDGLGQLRNRARIKPFYRMKGYYRGN